MSLHYVKLSPWEIFPYTSNFMIITRATSSLILFNWLFTLHRTILHTFHNRNRYTIPLYICLYLTLCSNNYVYSIWINIQCQMVITTYEIDPHGKFTLHIVTLRLLLLLQIYSTNIVMIHDFFSLCLAFFSIFERILLCGLDTSHGQYIQTQF